jgi:glycosyltransferase involved in cell wall biosynthesis
VVVTLTDPPLHLALAPVIGLCKGSRLVHWAQDLYPEVAVELQVLRRRSLLASLLRGVSNWSLRRHHAVVAVGECMKNRLVRRGLPSERVRVIPNWSLRPQAADDGVTAETVRRERGWGQRFVVMYSGNLGLAHPFDGILAAIERLRELEPRILFVLVGEGAQLERVRQQVGGAANVEILPRQPLARLDATLRAADVHLASMFERMAGLVVPSKVYGIVAAERPCVFLGPQESEAARLLVENQCGVVLPSDDGEGLARLLQDWCANPQKLEGMRENARRLAPEIGVERAVREFLEVLGEAAGTRSEIGGSMRGDLGAEAGLPRGKR